MLGGDEVSEGGAWYFLDAKYKRFSKHNRKGVPYPQEIYNVAISKYIIDIGSVFSSEPEKYHVKNTDDIRGSYIIMSNVDDYKSELSSNNRLYGAPVSILSDSSFTINQWNKENVTTDNVDRGSEATPAHRYGAIMLTPQYDQELRSLFQLIFEYLEADKSDNHNNLHFCWNCGSREPVIRRERYPYKRDEYGQLQEDRTKFPKYYVTCPKCKAFRVDNHCINCGKAIIKHTKGNYHRWDDSIDNSQWAFLCPDCGAPVNGFKSGFADNDQE